MLPQDLLPHCLPVGMPKSYNTIRHAVLLRLHPTPAQRPIASLVVSICGYLGTKVSGAISKKRHQKVEMRRSCGPANGTTITNDLVACVAARPTGKPLQDRNANAECESKHRKSNDARNQREAFGC